MHYFFFLDEKIQCEDVGSPLLLLCENGLLYITYANFGRTDRNVCPHPANNAEDCDSHADFYLELAQSRCQYLSSCQIPFGNAVHGDPCPNIFKYMEVHYHCLGNIVADPSTADYRDFFFSNLRMPTSARYLHKCTPYKVAKMIDKLLS